MNRDDIDWIVDKFQAVMFYLFIGVIFLAPIIYLAYPKVKYALADEAGKCAIDVRNKADREEVYGDYYCDENNQIQSRRAIADKQQAEFEKTATPKELCQQKLNNDYAYGDFEQANDFICNDEGNTVPIDSLVADETPAPTTPTEGQNCNIKGNISYNSGEKIYHVVGQAYYDETNINTDYGERWFCSEQEAINAGWRKAYE